uniref:TIL domain-containing protein n=2 Tax=Romanomermis culicivorax TaxID=13658 RepID=A0A915JWY5_ROMCU
MLKATPELVRRCGRNMEYMQCGASCERQCRDVINNVPPRSPCWGMCNAPGCYCRPGFARFYQFQYCVTESECYG